jgi:serine/threonine-protein kinase
VPGATPSRVRPAISSPALSEADRAFVQERLAQFAKWIFWPAFVFLAISYLPSIIAGRAPSKVLGPGFAAHLIATAALLAMWRYCSRGARSPAALRTLEGPGAAAITSLWVLMGLGGMVNLSNFADPKIAAIAGGFTVLLAATFTVLARAILVPSTLRRTLGVGLIGMAPLIPTVALGLHLAGFPTPAVIGGTLSTSVWIGAAIVTSAGTSRVIFGLRREVERTRRLGQYTIEHKIGAGGMGEVYRASHAMLRRPTAIKLLAPDAGDGDALRRFEREVQLTAGLSHPNTVSIYDYGRTPDGLFYYAMEYLDGTDLEQLVRDHGPVSAGRAIAILEQICGSLAEAHGIGLIHRDIKPANVILCPRGGEYDIVKVVDFGLVKEIEDGDAETSLSGASVLMGTPAYLSPEAISGGEIDGRADLYAVGAVGYWLVTGELVFEAGNLIEMCSHHLHTAPIPPTERAPDREIPADLAAVILRCLAKDPGDRYAGAGELRRALRDCADARTWGPEQAAAWWRARAGELEVEVEVATLPTVAVDLGDRLSEAPPPR